MVKRGMTPEEAAELSRRNRGAWNKSVPYKVQPGDADSSPASVIRGRASIGKTRQIARPPRGAKKQKAPVPSETDECLVFIEWSRLVLYKGRPLRDRVVKIPNERGKAGVGTAILTSIGMQEGFPDYILLAPVGRWGGLFIEAKKCEGGDSENDDQVRWRDLLVGFGYHAEICEGAAAMIEAVREYFRRAGCMEDGSFVDRARFQL